MKGQNHPSLISTCVTRLLGLCHSKQIGNSEPAVFAKCWFPISIGKNRFGVRLHQTDKDSTNNLSAKRTQVLTLSELLRFKQDVQPQRNRFAVGIVFFLSRTLQSLLDPIPDHLVGDYLFFGNFEFLDRSSRVG